MAHTPNDKILQIKISDLDKKLELQDKCTHPMYVTRCSICQKIISSEKTGGETMIEHIL